MLPKVGYENHMAAVVLEICIRYSLGLFLGAGPHQLHKLPFSNNIICEKTINLPYPIQGKEVAVVSMFSDNVQYQVKKPLKSCLPNGERVLSEGTFMGSELSTFVGRNQLITPMDDGENIIKLNKLTGITKMIVSSNELDNFDNLGDGKPSNVLLRHYLTSSEVFTNFEPVSPQYKKLKDVEFTSLTLRIKDQNNNNITA